MILELAKEGQGGEYWVTLVDLQRSFCLPHLRHLLQMSCGCYLCILYRLEQYLLYLSAPHAGTLRLGVQGCIFPGWTTGCNFFGFVFFFFGQDWRLK